MLNNLIPIIKYSDDLPILEKKGEIIEAINSHQVIIVTGETGSGKTTQIPKFCLEAGRGQRGKIGCTQPRRIAATSMAQRVADEIQSPLGTLIGYKIRFADKTGKDCKVQFMTDGILLAEIQNDPRLSTYDTIVIDEAHERSLNIDFLLGFLKLLLPQRPDLKLIISSATIDVEKFSKAFPLLPLSNDREFAPIIEVSGRMFPVEVRYHPPDEALEEKGETSTIDQVQEAIEEILTEFDSGDILVFYATTQEIRDSREQFKFLESEGYLVLSLFGSMSWEEQNRIFQSGRKRKIILATNVAETSITVPGIRYVIDTGRVRINRYHHQSGTEGLPIEVISQASANQRMGRCGRVGPGICIRLYDEEEFKGRDDFPTPEIQRSNLSTVILRMLHLNMGDVESFPFIDPPNSSSIRSGYRMLRELGAINEQNRLTSQGREIAALPVDPRTARMIVQAKHENVLYPVLIIASAISILDPREKPEDKLPQANQKHAPFKSKDSDLMELLNLWEHYHETLEKLGSQNKIRKFCKANFLSFTRIREWLDIHKQLHEIVRKKKWNTAKPDNWDYDAIHRSITAGYLSNIAHRKIKKEYQGTRNRELHLFPRSGQYRCNHDWIVAIELIETSRLFAHRVARIEPEWLERVAGQLCKLNWSGAHWDQKFNRVSGWEKVTLFGLILVEKRKVNYGRINPQEASQVFIREGLVEGKLKCTLPFWKHNQSLIQEVEKLENRIRKKDLMVDDPTLERFYQNKLEGVCSLQDLQKVIKQQGSDKFLFLKRSDLLRRDPEKELDLFPATMKIGDKQCHLKYKFDPSDPDDGVTLQIPISLLSTLQADPFEYLVPGFLKEKILFLLESLPKATRKKLTPLSHKVESLFESLTNPAYTTEKNPQKKEADFYEKLSDSLFQLTRIDIPPDLWNQKELPLHLKMNFSLRNPETGIIQASRKLKDLQTDQPKSSDDWERLIRPHERDSVLQWDFGDLCEKIPLHKGEGIPIWGYRALEEREGVPRIVVCKTLDEAESLSVGGLSAMMESRLGESLSWIFPAIEFSPETLLYFANMNPDVDTFQLERLGEHLGSFQGKASKGSQEKLRQETFDLIRRGVCEYDGNPCWTKKAFEKKVEKSLRELQGLAEITVKRIESTLKTYEQVISQIQRQRATSDWEYWTQLAAELNLFFPKNCLQQIPLEQWRYCPRILQTYLKRIEKAQTFPEKELQKQEEIAPFQTQIEELFAKKQQLNYKQTWALSRYHWMLEELKVSLFAQELKTAFPISPKRMTTFFQHHFSTEKPTRKL